MYIILFFYFNNYINVTHVYQVSYEHYIVSRRGIKEVTKAKKVLLQPKVNTCASCVSSNPVIKGVDIASLGSQILPK